MLRYSQVANKQAFDEVFLDYGRKLKPDLIVGQWNHLVVEARARTITVWLNGDLVNQGFDATVDQGKIALQAEGAEVEFRTVDIGPLSPVTK